MTLITIKGGLDLRGHCSLVSWGKGEEEAVWWSGKETGNACHGHRSTRLGLALPFDRNSTVMSLCRTGELRRVTYQAESLAYFGHHTVYSLSEFAVQLYIILQ